MKNLTLSQVARGAHPAYRYGLIGVLSGTLLSACGAPSSTSEVPTDAASEEANIVFDDDSKRASYGIGFNVAGNVAGQFSEFLDEEAFLAGLQDGIAGAVQQVPDADIAASMSALQNSQGERQAEVAVANLEAGQAFLAENGARPEVITLESGLQYEVLAEGSGAIPTATDTVLTHYHGSLPDGTVFDSSVERGQPASFPVGGVIRGFGEALQLMPVGSKWRLYVPGDLAYGDRGAGANIGPNQVLIFELELLEIDVAE